MRWILLKIVMFLGAFILTQLYVLPVAMAIHSIPLWVDIGLISLMLCMWLAAIDCGIKRITNPSRREHEYVE